MDLFGHARQGGHQLPALRGRPADHPDLRLPNYWNGLTTDSANPPHARRLPEFAGRVPDRDVPGAAAAHGAFLQRAVRYGLHHRYLPEERHSALALADHADFINVMPETLMSTVLGCLNTGRAC
jgi:hypothetical protein